MDRFRYLLDDLEYEQTTREDAVLYERMILIEESWQLFGHLPAGERYARTFRHIIEHMSVLIKPYELIVGHLVDTLMDEEQQVTYDRLTHRPANYGFDPVPHFGSFDGLGLVDAYAPSGPRYAPEWFQAWGHNTMDWAFVLKNGLLGIQKIIQKKLESSSLDDEQRTFYNNGLIAADAFMLFAQRYSEHAKELAQKEQDPELKQEYLEIARVCGRAVAHPAQSFREGLQTVWFISLILHGVCGARDYNLGRMDYYLRPYYENDIAKGVLTQEEAIELLRCLFIKSTALGGYGFHRYKGKRLLHIDSIQYVVLGGVDEQGNDVTNELSEVILKARALHEHKMPSMYVRYHEKMKDSFMDAVIECMKNGRGEPGLFNDEKVYNTLLAQGLMSEKIAHAYCHYACVNINLPGMDDELREAFNVYPKYLELAMNQGKDYITEREVMTGIRAPKELTTFDDLMEELRKTLKIGIKGSCDKMRIGDKRWSEIRPFSPESLFLQPCLEAGYDMTSGKSLPCRHMNQHCAGIATVGNSLYAIKRLVYDEKRFTLEEFSKILRANWHGYEELRDEVRNGFPKFGNDIKEVDDFVVMAGNLYCDEVFAQSPIQDNGRMLIPTFYTLYNAVGMGGMCGASADGRVAGETISENQSAVYNTDVTGPTAALNSISRLPFDRAGATGILNLRLQPSVLQGERGRNALKALLKGYFKQGGFGIQVAAVSKETLLDAKAHPEKHKNLLVRVTGFSMYFNAMSPDDQDELIARTEMGL